MPKRIDAQTDMNILRDIGMGVPNKKIAKEYGVSASYVSKLKTGKKVPDVYTIRDAVTTSTMDDDTIVKWLKLRIKASEEEIHIYTVLLEKFKGEE